MADNFVDISAAPREINPGNKAFLGGTSQGQIMDNNGNMYLFSSPRLSTNTSQPLNLQNDASSIYILANENSSSVALNGRIQIPYTSTNFTAKTGQTIQVQSQFTVASSSFDEIEWDEINTEIPEGFTDSRQTIEEDIKRSEQIRKEIEDDIDPDFEYFEDFLPESDEEEFFKISEDIEGIPIQLDEDKIVLKIIDEDPDTTKQSSNTDNFDVENVPQAVSRVAKITKNTTNFVDLRKAIIGNAEGGYFIPEMFTDGRLADTPENRKAMGTSGETILGMDRKNGNPGKGNTGYTSFIKFWKEVDTIRGNKKWKYNYIPQGNDLQRLINILDKYFLAQYENLLRTNGLTGKYLNVIESDGRLKIHFVYGVWNGPGHFQKFSIKLKKSYDSGITDPVQLAKILIDFRINYPYFSASARRIVSKSGRTLSKITGIS